MSAPLMIDNSVWASITSHALPEWRAAAFAQELEESRLGVCLPLKLGTACSVIGPKNHDEVMTELEELPRLPIDEEVERWALGARRRLARVGDNGMSTDKVMIAAAAHHFGAGVLHYDGDYDVLLEKTDLDFHSEWLMPRGSLN